MVQLVLICVVATDVLVRQDLPERIARQVSVWCPLFHSVQGYHSLKLSWELAQFADINECSMKNGGCSHDCTNTAGSYVCACPDTELSLADDKHTCEGEHSS